MLFLPRILSPQRWKWEPDFTPSIPLPPLLVWLGRLVLAYVAVYLVFLLLAPIDSLMSLLLG